MINLRQITPFERRLSSLLALVLDGSRLDGVVLRRINGSLQIQASFSVNLSLDPLTAAPELVGREIRNHLDAAEVRERRCVVGLPLKWALTMHTKLPDLPEADIASFLQIEAERGFPSDVSTLLLASSLCQTAGGEKHATQVGIPRNHINLLEQVLHAAQLKPVSFSLGITALQPAGAGTSDGSTLKGGHQAGVLALAIGESNIALQVTCGGGVAALRTIEGVLVTEGGRRTLAADVVAREARITLGQLPAEFREAVRHVRIFGPRDLAQQLADEIELRLEPMGLKVEIVTRYSANDFGVQIPPDTAVSPAFSLAAGRLTGRPSTFEFLPPKVTAWQQMAARYSSGKLRTTITAAGSLALLVGIFFFFQQWQLWSLGSQWEKLQPKYQELQAVQDKIKQYRPWFDESISGLTILRRLTESFPQDGSVTAKTLEIRDLNLVTCTGVARDNQALLRTLQQLRAVPGIAEVNIGMTRGQSPSVQFTFNFHWNQTDSHASQ